MCVTFPSLQINLQKSLSGALGMREMQFIQLSCSEPNPLCSGTGILANIGPASCSCFLSHQTTNTMSSIREKINYKSHNTIVPYSLGTFSLTTKTKLIFISHLFLLNFLRVSLYVLQTHTHTSKSFRDEFEQSKCPHL